MASRHNYGSDFYNLTLKKMLKCELLSFFGRLFSKKIIKTKKKYLNLGCGNDNLYLNDEFLHCDFYDFNFFNIFRKKSITYLDLRCRLPFADNTFEGCFSEHVLEHLYPNQAAYLMVEVLRVLKPGGVFRVIVPDIKIAIKYYNNVKDFSDGISRSGCEAIWDVSQNYEHKSLWDSQWLNFNLKKNGFSDSEEYQFKISQNQDLLLDREDRKMNSIYIEAIKQ